MKVLSGPNFSGRTTYLRQWAGLREDMLVEPGYCRAAYIGPDPGTALSGIAPTVAAELE